MSSHTAHLDPHRRGHQLVAAGGAVASTGSVIGLAVMAVAFTLAIALVVVIAPIGGIGQVPAARFLVTVGAVGIFTGSACILAGFALYLVGRYLERRP